MSDVQTDLPSSTNSSEERYRPNVAIILTSDKGEILICERIDENGMWQFPQGGVDKGEGYLSALYRETWEEIGLEPQDYELIDLRGGYKYKYPPGVREKKKKKHNCVGQEQTYFLCKITSSKKRVNIDQSPAEFQNHKWINPKEFKLKWLPEFKHEIYKKVFRDFFDCKIK